MLTALLQKALKQNKSSKKGFAGFTLIELMVAITIIAILAVIGVTVYSGVQKSARDAKRRADIDAIASALESNKAPNSTTYSVLATTQFSAGAIPTDQFTAAAATSCGGQACKYCVLEATTIGAAAPANPTAAACGGGTVVSAANPTAAATSWTICANLETGTGAIYCKSSAQ